MSDSLDRPETPTVPGDAATVTAVLRRELSTTVVTASQVVLTVALTGIVLALGIVGGGYRSGYVGAVVDLSTPLQVLLPVVAIAVGYDAIVGDQRRGILDVLETYPVDSWHVVVGTYVGRAIGLVGALGVALLVAFVPVATTRAPRLPGYAAHTGTDSPVLYLRFVVLTVLFALVLLAIAVALSAVVSTTRTALVAATLAVLVLVFGFDVALTQGFAVGFVGEGGLLSWLAVSPLSAYRGLILETVVASPAGPRAGAPLASLASLLAWGLGALAVATVAVGR